MTDEAPAVANPWLVGPAPTAKLPADRLEERILNLLASQNMCVLATTGPGGALATPVRYYNLAFTLVFTAQEDTPKLRNIRREPRVSIGVFAPLVGQASSRGAQLFGDAHIVYAGDALFEAAMIAYRWQSDAVERGRSLSQPPTGPAVIVEVSRVVYTEHWLRREGYAPRQHWRRGND